MSWNGGRGIIYPLRIILIDLMVPEGRRMSTLSSCLIRSRDEIEAEVEASIENWQRGRINLIYKFGQLLLSSALVSEYGLSSVMALDSY